MMRFYFKMMRGELQQVQFFCFLNRLGPVIGAELAINVAGVVANRIDTDDQFFGDFLVFVPFDHQA